MHPKRSLEKVIRKVSSSYKVNASVEVVVPVNKRTLKFEPKPRIWQKIEYYLICDARTLTNVAECNSLTYKITDFASGRSIEIAIDYIASCKFENAAQVSVALHNDDLRPVEILDRKMKAIVSNFIQGKTALFISDLNVCFESLNRLQFEIAEKIINDVGLSLETKIRITNASQFVPFVIEEKGLVCKVSDFSSEHSLDLVVDYRASCSTESVGKAVRVLYNEHYPAAPLNRKIEKWMAKLTGNRAAEIVENFDIEIDNLKRFLRERAKKETGITLELRFSTKDKQKVRITPEKLTPYDTDWIRFSIRLKDYDKELDFEIRATLDVVLKRREKAVKYLNKELLFVSPIKTEVKKYFLQKSFQDFYSKLQDSIREEIVQRLNEVVADFGREIVKLSISTKSLDKVREKLLPRDFLEEKYETDCYVKGYDKQIRVKNILHLKLENLALYNRAFESGFLPLNTAGKPDLKKWAQEKLESIVKSVLFEQNYVDLLLEFEPESNAALESPDDVELVTQPEVAESSDGVKDKHSCGVEAQILQKMTAAAYLIGYSVVQIVSIPELEQFKLKGNFTVKTGKKEYATKSSNFTVGLDTVAIIRIDNLKDIERRLRNSDRPLIEQIEDAIDDVISQHLNSVDPEQFYMSFNVDRGAKTTTVEQELIVQVTDELKTKFSATVISVIPKVADTPLLELYGDLQGQVRHFQFEFSPANHDGEKVSCKGRFEVLEVGDADWNKFYGRFKARLDYREQCVEGLKKLNSQKIRLMQQPDSKDEVAETQKRIDALESEAYGFGSIREALQDDFSRILRRNEIDVFRSNNTELLPELESYLNERVKGDESGSIKAMFGLILNISQMEWEIIESEKPLFANKPKVASVGNRLEAVKKRIGALENRLLKATEAGADWDEQEELAQQIASLYTQADELQDQMDSRSQEMRQLVQGNKQNSTFNLPKTKQKPQGIQGISNDRLQAEEFSHYPASQQQDMKSAKPQSETDSEDD